MVVRDADKGEEVRRTLADRVPGADLVVDRCDVGDLDDVRRFVDGLDLPHLDVLVHNAGAMPPQRTESKQGHELTMALHVLGPVLMTELLRPRLTDGRVVLVTSGGMYGQRLRDDDPEYLAGDYSPTTAYARSKRAQVELLPVLQDRWGPDGISVTATPPGLGRHPRHRGLAAGVPPLVRTAAAGRGGWRRHHGLGGGRPARPGGRPALARPPPRPPTCCAGPARATPSAPGCGPGCGPSSASPRSSARTRSGPATPSA